MPKPFKDVERNNRMKLLPRLGRKPESAHRPVVIDCIGALDQHFANAVRTAVATIDLARPVLVEFKRATIDDMRGLTAIADTIGERRGAGGYAAFVTGSARMRNALERSGVPGDYVVADSETTERRRIILAQASTRSAFAT